MNRPVARCSRQELAAQEEGLLAPYAMTTSRSRGRMHSEPEDELQTPFQQDRDRIVHTSAFRRLEYKTQVFVNHEGDYYRTRLTHTIEVAEVARAIARALRLNSDLVESISYAHDLGHPPFGHSGEEALATAMAEHGGFEHNGQALRIVTYLEERFPGFRGLNLSWEVLEGIAKHSTSDDGYQSAEYDPGRQPTVEGQICSFADEIAYNSHDLDDGLRSGRLDAEQLRDTAIWREASERCAVLVKSDNQDVVRHQTVRFVIEAQVDDLIAETVSALETLDIERVDDLRDCRVPVAHYSPAMAARNAELKAFLYRNLYCHYGVVRMQQKAKRVIADLFRAYLDCIAQLPPSVTRRIGDESVERVVCDYIAGMTDRFALDEHAKLFDPGVRV